MKDLYSISPSVLSGKPDTVFCRFHWSSQDFFRFSKWYTAKYLHLITLWYFYLSWCHKSITNQESVIKVKWKKICRSSEWFNLVWILFSSSQGCGPDVRDTEVMSANSSSVTSAPPDKTYTISLRNKTSPYSPHYFHSHNSLVRFWFDLLVGKTQPSIFFANIIG